MELPLVWNKAPALSVRAAMTEVTPDAAPAVASPASPGLRAAARVAALGAVIGAGVLLRFGDVNEALALLPLAAGLFALMSEKTWGGFATLGGSALVVTAVALGGLPVWALALGLGGLAVALPALIHALRFDASAALVWVAVAGLFGGGTAAAWAAFEESCEHGCPGGCHAAPESAPLQKELPIWDGWTHETRSTGFHIRGSVRVF